MTDFSAEQLSKKVKRFYKIYSSEQSRWLGVSASQPKDKKKRADALRKFVSREIKWTEELESHLDRGTVLQFDAACLRQATAYRPFVQCATYYAKVMTHRIYLQNRIFPISGDWNNLTFGFSGAASSKSFSTLGVNILPSFDLLEKTQFVPLVRYDDAGNRVDNITDWGLKQIH